MSVQLPDCPKHMECSITFERMSDPVVAEDTHTYEKSAINEWFARQAASGKPITSPLTHKIIGTRLVSNQSLKTQIEEWVEGHQRGEAAERQLVVLQGEVFRAATSEGALSLVGDISELVTTSSFCILGVSGVETLKDFFGLKRLLTDELSTLLDVLTSQCRHEIEVKQKKHQELDAKCDQLESIKNTMKSKHDGLKQSVVETTQKLAAAEKKVPTRAPTTGQLPPFLPPTIIKSTPNDRTLSSRSGGQGAEVLSSAGAHGAPSYNSET